MTLLKKMVLAVSLLVASSFASAAVYDLDTTTSAQFVSSSVVNDSFTFTLDNDSVLDQVLTNFAFFGGFDPLGFSIVDAATSTVVGVATAGLNGSMVIDALNLQAGDYATVVSGDFNGSYGIYWLSTSVTAVSPVPEASTLAMILGGLGLVGFMARRRKVA